MVEFERGVGARYVIVGAGTAGCTLASRLSERQPAGSVILIEAGSDVSNHELTSSPLACFSAHLSELDWNYSTVPQQHLNDRECYAAAGKAVSGGSAINYGTWTRGPAVDFDLLAHFAEDQSWTYDALLPYFRRTETCEDRHLDERQHGQSGPIHTTSVSSSSPSRAYRLRDTIKKGWQELGLNYVVDVNAGNPLGFTELVENFHDGKRQLPSEAYNLDNVKVLPNTLVSKVIVNDVQGTKRAVGVVLDDGTEISVSREVMLSAGAYRTPQLLMLSGIGDPGKLSRLNIPTHVNLPEVGRNFHDHVSVSIWWTLRHPEQGLAVGSQLWTEESYGYGVPCDYLAWQHTPDNELRSALHKDGVANVDAHPLLHPQRCHTETVVTYGPERAAMVGMKLPFDGSHIATPVLLLTPTSRGSINIASSNVADPPLIDPNYFATEADRCMLRAGVRQALRLFQDTSTGKEAVVDEEPPEGFPRLHAASGDAEIDARATRTAGTFYHGAGSASLGLVVDSRLRVYGIERLRVVDASILTVPIAAHYQAIVHALAEKAADMVLQDRQTSKL